jgi:O-methyltransferase involved in polyketide biosynthesis
MGGFIFGKEWSALRITLKNEMETLLIPLYGRAKMSKKGMFPDNDAESTIAQIDYDFSKLRIPEKTQIMLSIRGSLIDDFTKEFLAEHPDSTVIYLGCGLDSRAKRLNFPAKLWYDLDFPQVIDIKRQLYDETKNYRYISSSVTDWEWMDNVECDGSPVLIIAEGLLMYLNENDIRALFLKMRDKFRDAVLIFDAYSKLTARYSSNHPSLKKTGAAILWGVDSPELMEAYGDGITYIKTIYLTDENAIKRLPGGYRAMFRFAGKFNTAKEAHRIIVMKLSAH